MARNGARKTKQKRSSKARSRKALNDKFVAVANKSYGKALRGIKIYYEGKRPNGLKDDGSITFGKHILETLNAKFERVRWIITEETDTVTTEYGIVRVRTSQRLLRQMSTENWDRSRDIKNDIVRRFFSVAYPGTFAVPTTSTYVPGTLANLLSTTVLDRLTTQDKEALNAFLPAYVSSESIGMVGGAGFHGYQFRRFGGDRVHPELLAS